MKPEMVVPNTTSNTSPVKTERQRWMAVLARADRDVLEKYFSQRVIPSFSELKKAETGTIMLEGRAGGSGRRFNIGEATVTRCVIKMGSKMGYSYALGHDRRKAVLAAVADALLQTEAYPEICRNLIEPLAKAQLEARLLASRKAAASKVDFFTLMRGDG